MSPHDEQKMLEGIAQWQREQRERVLAKAGVVLNEQSVEYVDHVREASRQRMIEINRRRAERKHGDRKPPESVRPLLQGHVVPPSVFRRAAAAVATEFGQLVPELLSKNRDRNLVQARHVLMLLLVRRGYSTPTIGRSFGKHHTTVLYGSVVTQERLRTNAEFREKVERLETQIELGAPPGSAAA